MGCQHPLFGLTNSEGNHGEDVKEYYFYLDNTPTHSYMKYLYRYPFAYPYADLVQRSGCIDPMEYELIDTGALDDDRYFDVFVEYAKNTPEDILIRLTVTNRSAERHPIHLLPTLWFRNTWAWDADGRSRNKPGLSVGKASAGFTCIEASDVVTVDPLDQQAQTLLGHHEDPR